MDRFIHLVFLTAALLPLLVPTEALTKSQMHLTFYKDGNCRHKLGERIYAGDISKCHHPYANVAQSVELKAGHFGPGGAIAVFYEINQCIERYIFKSGNSGCQPIHGYKSLQIQKQARYDTIDERGSANNVNPVHELHPQPKTDESGLSELEGNSIPPMPRSDDASLSEVARFKAEQRKFVRDGYVHGEVIQFWGKPQRLHQTGHGTWNLIPLDEWDDKIHIKNFEFPPLVRPRHPADEEIVPYYGDVQHRGFTNASESPLGSDNLRAACHAVADCALQITKDTYDFTVAHAAKPAFDFIAKNCAKIYHVAKCSTDQIVAYFEHHTRVHFVSKAAAGVGTGTATGYFAIAIYNWAHKAAEHTKTCPVHKDDQEIPTALRQAVLACIGDRGNSKATVQSLNCKVKIQVGLSSYIDFSISAQATTDHKGHETHKGECDEKHATKRKRHLEITL